MSNIYIQEPPTSGKVVMTTTVGDIEIELWSKEAPLACRNFVQLCMEGYYDKTIFHRLVPSFVVQGGDPSGTGFGGESVYGGPFRDELHTRLRFVRRGLLAMANSGEKNSNGSQFFFTLGATPDLENKHTIFGKIAGDTIYNLLKFSDMEVDANERPVCPQKILRTEVLTNPFPDIEPRNLKLDEDKVEIVQVTSKARATKDEVEDEEEQSTSAASVFGGKPRSSHDLTNDPRLSSQSVLQDVMDLPTNDGDLHASNRQHEKSKSRSASPASDVPRIPSEFDDKVWAVRVTKRKAAELMEELTKCREKEFEVSGAKPERSENDEPMAACNSQLDNQENIYESRKREAGEDREDTVGYSVIQMEQLNSFDEYMALPQPEIRKNMFFGRRNDLSFASCSMQGWRKSMEDSTVSMVHMKAPLEASSFFGIFDGHGGSGASSYCSEKMVGVLTHTEEFSLLKDSTSEKHGDLITQGLVRAFLMIDERMRQLPQFLLGLDRSGSTAICALVTPSDIFLANCGDSGAIIVSNGITEVVTRKHTPTEPAERSRIRRAGGKVARKRVGTLALSRTLGDFRYKSSTSLGPTEQLISPEPEIYQLIRHPCDEFIVLASDGVWDVMSSEDVNQFVRSRLLITDDLEVISGEIADHCLEKGSRDNISVTIVLLAGARSIPLATSLQQKAMYQSIKQAVRDVIAVTGDSPMDVMTLNFMVNRMCARSGEVFFPGSAVCARRIIAERAWKALQPCKPLMPCPANKLDELDMAVVEHYFCRHLKKTICGGGEVCADVGNRNSIPFPSGFIVCALELDAIQVSYMDDSAFLRALRKIAVYKSLNFRDDGKCDNNAGPAVAFFLFYAQDGSLCLVRINSRRLATVYATLLWLTMCGIFRYNPNVDIKFHDVSVPLETTFEALRNCGQSVSEDSIFLFLLQE